MSVNVSKQKRDRLVEKINKIKKYIASAKQDENTAQLLTYIADIEKDIKGKKYGLVFEEHREAIDEILEQNTPVLTEEKDLFIDNGGQMNFLIEGDNLAALQLLEKTHKGKIDLIYIDPPYNTGNKDFVYDDTFVDSSDLFAHSKWLSFMSNRLKYACKLLSDGGLIYISINDKEEHPLKLLCDELFGSENFVNAISIEMSPSSGVKRAHKAAGYIKNKETILVYCKGYIQIKALYNEWTTYDKHYSIYFDGNRYASLSLIIKEHFSEYKNLKAKFYVTFDEIYNFIVANANNIYRSHDASRWAIENVQSGITLYQDNNLKIIKVFNPTEISEYEILKTTTGAKGYDRLEPLAWNVVDGKIQTLRGDLWLDFDKDMGNVSKEGGVKFPNGKKPVRLLKEIIYSAAKQNSTVLDFFAGSGTTGHAVMKLNAEDGGKRKFILCTNNENSICRDVTYERIKRVIARDKYEASLKYYKVDFVPISDKLYYEYADELLKHIRELVELENGINFNGNAEIAIVLTEKELDEFAASIPDKCKTIYLGHDVLPSEAQDSLFKARGIAVNIIPDYYYRELEG